MKEYIIRNVGWVHNDSTYEYDGNYQVVARFTDKAEAEAYRSYFNRIYLVYWFDMIHRFETWTDFHKEYQDSRNAINDFLVNEIGFNPTIKVYPSLKGYSASMFMKKPDDKTLDTLLEKFGISFFNVIEYDSSDQGFFIAHRSPSYFRYSHPLMDYNGEFNLTFSSRVEAMEIFIQRERDCIEFYENPLFKKSISNLTQVPALLEKLIDESEYLNFENNHLFISTDADAKTLASLNALLKEPFLTFEAISKVSHKEFNMNFVEEADKENEWYWEEMEKRFAKFSSEDALRQSKDYLSSYCFSLPTDTRFYKYPQIIAENLAENPIKGMEVERGHLTYKRYTIPFFGVVSNVTENTSLYHVESYFGIDGAFTVGDGFKGIGTAQTIQEAFENSLDDWCKKNKELILKEIEKWIKKRFSQN